MIRNTSCSESVSFYLFPISGSVAWSWWFPFYERPGVCCCSRDAHSCISGKSKGCFWASKQIVVQAILVLLEMVKYSYICYFSSLVLLMCASFCCLANNKQITLFVHQTRSQTCLYLLGTAKRRMQHLCLFVNKSTLQSKKLRNVVATVQAWHLSKIQPVS